MIQKNEFIDNVLYYDQIRKAYMTNPEWQIRRKMKAKKEYKKKCQNFIQKVFLLAKKEGIEIKEVVLK